MFWLMWRLMFYHWVPEPVSKAKHLITLELLHLLKVPRTRDWAKLTQVVGEQPACFRCWSTFAAALYLDGRHMAALEWYGRSTSSAACQQIHTLGCIQWNTSWPRRFARSWYIPTFYRFLVLIISNHFPRADKRCKKSTFSVQDLAKGSPLQGISNWILSRKIHRKPIACSCMYINTVEVWWLEKTQKPSWMIL